MAGGKAIWITAATQMPGLMSCATSQPVEVLDGTGERLILRSVMTYRYDDHPDYKGERKVVTLDYAHSIADICPETGKERERFAWHWHPSIQAYDFPHLHIDKGMPDGLGKLHLPSGRVAIEQVMLFMIDDLGVSPAGKPDERDTQVEILKATLERFKIHRTWA